MSSPLVGLVGYAQAGKDTFAGFLGYRRIAFADALKAAALVANPFIIETADSLAKTVDHLGWEQSKKCPTVREFLQNFGMGIREHVGEDAWVDAAFKDYDPTVPTVITDVRFPNEIARIRSLGGIIVRIDRKGHAPVNAHVSEFAWQAETPDKHYTFANGALHHMQRVAEHLDRELRGA